MIKDEVLDFNIFNILIITGVIQGLIFGFVILFFKKYKSTPNKYLAQLIIYLSLSNLYYWFLDTNLSDGYKYYEYVYIPWNLLILPMYYFFVVAYLKYELTKKEMLYFKMPFIISLTVHLCLLIHTLFFHDFFRIPIRAKHFFYYSEEYFSILFTLYLIYKVYGHIKKYEIENNLFSLTNVSVNTKWLKQLLYFGLLICFFWFIIIFYNHYTIKSLFINDGKYILWISMSILIYWLGYLGIYHVGIFTERQEIRTVKVKIGAETKTKTITKTEAKSSSNKSNLNYSRFEEIDIAIKSNHLYLNPNLSLESLAEDFNLSTGYISQLINEFTKSNFSNYINKFRVVQCKSFLIKREYADYTIVAIGLEAGFNSKSAFYNAFKKEENCSPFQFKKLHEK